MANERIQHLGDDNFKSFVDNATTPVLVDFWAEWCGPCKMIAPVLEEVSSEYQDKVSFAKLNVDQHKGVPSEYRIISIPTLVVFKGGQEVERCIGFKTKKELKELLDKYV